MKTSPVKVSVVLISLAVASGLIAAENDSLPSSSTQVMVEIDGTKLTLADLGRKHPGGMFKAYQNFYQTQRKVVAEWVDEYLLDRAAQKEGVTVDELLNRHVKKPAEKLPSEEALRTYYDGVDTDETYEAMRQRIVDHIRETKETKLRTEYLKQLRSDAKINVQFGPPRADLSLKDHPVRGPQNAQVVIAEFADYECPYCQQTQPAVDQIETEYKGKIAFVFKDMPLPNHAHAEKAAEATHCATAQGKYWEYHDMLFKTHELDVAKLSDHAKALNMDVKAFEKCMSSDDTAAAVKAEFSEGVNLGLQGTPGFFINGRYFSGSMTPEQFRAVIVEELAISAAKEKQTAQQ
jgi:protein-disulfide isomerase